GIRDRNVTGVQTCALPIFASPWRDDRSRPSEARAVPRSWQPGPWIERACKATHQDAEDIFRTDPAHGSRAPNETCTAPPRVGSRSEERRVGKEGRARRWGV